MESAFKSVVQALDQNAESVANSLCGEDGGSGSGAGGQQKSRTKKGGGSSSGSKKKTGKEPATQSQLDDNTIISIITTCLEGTDDDWASLSPAKLRTLLLQADSTAAVSEKRMKGIKTLWSFFLPMAPK
jgi:hypothetical protein